MLRLTFSFELLVVATGVRHVRSYQESEVTNTLFDKTASSQLPNSKNLVTVLFQSFVNFLFMCKRPTRQALARIFALQIIYQRLK